MSFQVNQCERNDNSILKITLKQTTNWLLKCYISQINFYQIKLEAEPQRHQNNSLMISELRSRCRIEFQKIPTPRIISQPKKISKNEVPKISGDELFPNRNVIIRCLLINEMISLTDGC